MRSCFDVGFGPTAEVVDKSICATILTLKPSRFGEIYMKSVPLPLMPPRHLG
jgi:hypothetical protein